jgi:hypothetical protein
MRATAERVERPTPAPRLLNLHAAANYLGVSFWTLRDWLLQGLIPVVELPALRPREGERSKKQLRRVLVDVRDLDTFVEGRKRKEIP